MVAMFVVPGVFAADNGMSFGSDTLYPLAKNPDAVPQTFEARIHIPKGVSVTGNVIIGNNTKDAEKDRYDFVRIQFTEDRIRLCGFYTLSSGSVSGRYIYFGIDPRDFDGKTFHIAVVTDLVNDEAYAYLTFNGTTTKYDGVFGNKSPSTADFPLTSFHFTKAPVSRPYYIGGDLKDGPKCNCQISEIALFSDVRTEAEVKADAAGTGITKEENLMVWLKLSEDSATKGAPDLSGNGYHMGVQAVDSGNTTYPTCATVTFNSNGGTPVAEQIVIVGQKATDPGVPTKSGFEFGGWYNGTEQWNFNNAVTGALILTAKWVDTSTTPTPETTTASPETTTASPETTLPSPVTTASPETTLPAPETTAAPETTKAAASTSSVSSPLLTLVMRYAQKFPIQLYGEHYTIKGDSSIKYKRGGTITIIPDAGYEIVDVVANGQSLGAVNEVTFKKVTKAPELLVITKAIG